MKGNRPVVIWPYEGEKTQKCRSCPQIVFYKKMVSGKFAPICFDGDFKGQNHFINCKDAERFRKPKEKQTGLFDD